MQSGGAEMDIPIVPLIDMAFQLIFFFVITGAEQAATFDEQIKLADARWTKPMEGEKLPEGVVVNVREDGTINIGNQEMNIAALTQVLLQAKKENPELGFDMSVIIRSDKNALYKHVDKVVTAVQKAQLYKIRLIAAYQEPKK